MSDRPTATDFHQSEREVLGGARSWPVDRLRALAERHRLRGYRDPCADWNIPGRWGEIFWYGVIRAGASSSSWRPARGAHANGSRKALVPEGLAEVEEKRPTKPARVGGRPRRVLWLRRNAVQALWGEDVPSASPRVTGVTGYGG